MVSFDVTREDAALIAQIVERATKTGLPSECRVDDALCLSMDLYATHANGCPLDLEKLLNAPEFSFWHDIRGIERHINRETGQLEDCFLPRCAKPEAA